MNRAVRHEAAGQFTEAEALYRQVLADNPGNAAAWHALGLLAFNAQQLDTAAQYITHAVMQDGYNAIYQRNLGELCRRLGRLEQAIACGFAATKLAPKDLDAYYNLGLAYTDAKDFPKAIQSYRKALKINPGHGLSWNNLGSVLEQQGDKAEAEKAYAKAVRINPQHAEAQNNLGAIYSEQGKLDEARACFEAAIAARSDFVEAHYNLSSLKTYTKDDPHLAMLEEVYAHRAILTDHARIRYCFALGKALDDTGDYDRAFAAYDEGNRLQHALLPMDEARADALLEQIIQVFDSRFFAERRQWRGQDDAKRTPVFIVGMPRSGTTLLEQILCSHPSVHGAGELADLNEVITAATGASGEAPFTNGIIALTEEDLRRIGEDYLKRVWKHSPKSAFITDKMPANFFYLGLIHLALPRAKIIHAMRDPMDSCFSCYSRLFNDSMDFAYDQGTLGRYYVRYMKLMKHWYAVLPEGSILDLPYEAMVADTETQAKRVLAFVGLPWNENCLHFHQNKRLVKTASVAQVRKPIYQTSVARWKHFARHLNPLLEIVQDYRVMEEADKALLAAGNLPADAANTAEAHHLEGIALYKQGRLDEALSFYDRALELQPDFPAAWNSKGFVLQDMDRLDEALVCFSRAVELAPEFAMARLNLGMAQLKAGDWDQGWANYEARWTGSAEAGNGSLNRPACSLPVWDGQPDTRRQRLLVVTEQGYGDTFQFSRYLNLAAERFAKVGFVCSPPTQRLMEWSFGGNILTMTRMPADDEAWDWQCPLMSLPRVFKTRPDTVPAHVPYLRVPGKALDHWRERLELSAPGRFRIGIAWAGRKTHQYDSRRSLRFEQLLPLLQNSRITWVSLQKWAPEDQRPAIPPEIDWLDWTEELSDFADTAALLSGLDMVISIDSSMVHLAAALGRPVWMMDRFDNEWRWLRHRADSPWYPTLRIFRQPALGDWNSVLRKVAEELNGLPALSNAAPSDPRKKPLSTTPSRNPGETAAPPLFPIPPGTIDVDQAMQLASQYQSAGRLAEAENLLRRILQTHPQHAHALHLLGVVAYQSGHPVMAMQQIVQAVALEPDVALFHSNLAEMCRQQGRVEEAIRHGKRAVELDPSLAAAFSNLGIAYYDATEYGQAEACQKKALALEPHLLQALNNLGSIERARKNREGAMEWYRKALAVHPEYPEALSNLGAVLVENDDADEAVPVLEKSLQLMPNYPEALCNLGLARLVLGRTEEAMALLSRSLELKPDYPEALVGLARALREQDQLPEALQLLQRAIGIAPGKADAWCQLGTVHIEEGDAGKAEEAYRHALDIDPAMPDATVALGNLRLEEGKIDDAVELLQQALQTDPKNLGARFHLAYARKVTPEDENLRALEEMLADKKTMGDDKRISLHYALGKAYDDLQAWDNAFPHFIEGARLKRKKLHYDPSAEDIRLHRLMDIADGGFIQRMQGAGDASDVPVFVLGMPRSGTTLTEQIIASHPEVHGAGELRDLMEIVQRPVAGHASRSFPENLLSLTRETLSAWGSEYTARLRRRAPDARRITDKMPANYLALGLIPLMLPNARIIHVKRNPVDTCVSCFTRLFSRHQDATYNLAELGRHYANYARLMQHWRRVLPEGRFMEVQYEDIVADMETQARRLIEYCGLEWNDACLAFHKTKRNIRTASVAQVRQPIYTSSVERWRHYEKYLGPLLDALGEFAPKV